MNRLRTTACWTVPVVGAALGVLFFRLHPFAGFVGAVYGAAAGGLFVRGYLTEPDATVDDAGVDIVLLGGVTSHRRRT